MTGPGQEGNQPNVKLVDAGGIVVISGKEPRDVEAALNDRIARGGSLVSPLSKVGGTWLAAYVPPLEPSSADQTSTLSLEELWSEPVNPHDKCRIEMLGFTWMITASMPAAVKSKIRYLRKFGATSLSDIEKIGDDQWIAACDVAQLYEAYLKW